ncbi:STAS domain-containing protein [Mycolicibacterium sp. XJ1819]
MSTTISPSDPSNAPPEPQSLTEPAASHAARFATKWLRPDTAVITAHGEIDAANAHDFVEYALHHADNIDRLVLDLSGVEFFGTTGFSALHTLNVRCAGESIDWASVPSAAVTRLLRICDPDSTLPFFSTLKQALAALQGEPRRLLQLVPKTG